MTYRSGIVSGVLATLMVLGAGLALRWVIVGDPIALTKSAPPPIPATVPKPANESQFNTVILKKEAEDSLNLSFGQVEKKPMPRSRFYGGEITIPAGQTIVVSAPFSGMLEAAGGVAPTAGAKVNKGKAIFNLLPLLTPEGRANLASTKVDAEGLVENAKTQFTAADIALKRAKKLLKGEAGSQRMVDDAEAAYNLAEKVLDAAKERLKTLVKITGEVEKGTAAAIPIEAPADGILRTLSASHGQNVPGGALLFEVLDLNPVWVRVPVFVGERNDINDKAPALVGSLTGKSNEKRESANRVEAPPSANALAGSVDLFYSLPNRAEQYSPGERVGVTLQLKTDAESLTVPRGAILYDASGGTWVYEAGAEHTYTRRRVQVNHIDGDIAVLTTGPPPGTKIVVNGAIELFGTETGYSK